MIVIILISIVYYFTINTFNIKTQVKNVNLYNLKEKLLNYGFNNSISLQCINDGKLCHILVDGEVIEDTIVNLFDEKPTVYTYDKKLDIIDYPSLELNKFDIFDVCFVYSINKYQKSNDMIVEVGEKVYIFNSIYNKPTNIEYISDISIYFDDKIQEVKDAF
ncbi:MAG TPA: hypothetical protein EYG97_03750 [Arcobacter sp.]|nr:hypothetical protein [Arcobacter sp.]HIP56117.1 hypothetical protein [Arcobacter sp.]